jgi:hypothetical protein
MTYADILCIPIAIVVIYVIIQIVKGMTDEEDP